MFHIFRLPYVSVLLWLFPLVTISLLYRNWNSHTSTPQLPVMSVPAVRYSASGAANAAIIFMHGLGDSGSGWSFLPEFFQQSGKFGYANIVLPNAPLVPVTVNNGMRMPAWFDIYEFGKVNARQDTSGMARAVKTMEALIKEQLDLGIKPERIVIGGFSQGAAITTLATLTSNQKFGAAVVLSGWVPAQDHFLPLRSTVNAETPVFIGHGIEDPIITVDRGRNAKEVFQKFGNPVEFHEYPGMPHSTCPQEMVDLTRFLEKVIPPE